MLQGIVALTLTLSGCAETTAPADEVPSFSAGVCERGPRCELPEMPFQPTGKSLRARRSIVVRGEPSDQGTPIGTLAQDMRVTWSRVVPGPGCDSWVEISPRGWVCGRYLEDNFREPRVRELPKLDEDELVPGVYARVTNPKARLYASAADARWRRHGRRFKGTLTVQLDREVKLGGRRFWRTASDQYIEVRYLQRFAPSPFSGLDEQVLTDWPLPLAWAQGENRSRPVPVFEAPELQANVVTMLSPRSVVKPLERSLDGAFTRIDRGWLRTSDLHVANWTMPPDEVGTADRWIDLDLEQQTLVAYEGDRPVFATLVSTGKPEHETPQGLFRIWIKYAETDMTGRMASAGYEVANVPWTMFFFESYGLHAAYWHDRFGQTASHGCVNLSPLDARTLYQWTEPNVPHGWSMSYATAYQPGSWVRIRGVPTPVAAARP